MKQFILILKTNNKMKKVFLFLGAILLSANMWAGGGIFEAWLTIATIAEQPVAHKINDGIALGTINQGLMDSVFIKVYKNNGTDIQEVYLCYKVDDGEVQEKACVWGKDLGGNDQEWNAKLNIDFVKDMTDGEHTIELWCKAKSNQQDCEEFVYMNNGGSNYALTFTKGTPAVITYKDTAYYVAGNFTSWAAEMKALPYEVELPADSALEFKQVMTRTILSDGDSIGQDTTWYGQANEGNYMTRESSAWTLDGGYNVLLTTDQKGKYVFDMNEKGEFVVTFPAIDSTIYLIAKSANWEEQAMNPVDDTLFSVKVNYEAAVVDTFLLLQHTTWWKIADDAIDMSRESCTNWGLACVAPEGKGLKDVTVRIDKAGEYEFIWDNKNHLISIVYPAAEVKRDTTMYVAGNFTNWAEEMQALPYTVALPADSTIEFKQVRIIITTMDGEVADRDTTWFGQAGEGNKMTRESSAWLLDGENNVLLTTDAEGEYTFALNENGEFVVTWPYKCQGEFGLLVNGTYLPAEINPEHDGGTEYMLVDVELAVNDSVQLFDHCSLAGWADGVQYMEGSYEFFIENNKFVIKEAGLYDFYFQLGSPDLLYVKLHSDPQAVENIEATSVAVKFIENGQLYIIRGEHTFDAQGKMIR